MMDKLNLDYYVKKFLTPEEVSAIEIEIKNTRTQLISVEFLKVLVDSHLRNILLKKHKDKIDNLWDLWK